MNAHDLRPNMNRYFNKSMNNSNTFDNVTDLTLHDKAIVGKCQYYFSNFILLTLDDLKYNGYFLLTIEDIQCAKMIVNLSNLKHLNISKNYLKDT